MQQEKTKVFMTYWSRIIAIAMPMIIQGLVFQLQSLTDKIFLGKIDALYISAIGAAQFPFNTTLDGFVALSTGVVIIVAQLMGAHNRKKVNDYVKSAIFYNTLSSIGLFIIWFIFPVQILNILNVDEIILEHSVLYVRVCAFYFLVAGIDTTLQAMLQGMGHTKPIMYAGIMKVVLNVVLSWLLIFGHCGLPRLYLLGAAIGTVTANILSALMIMGYCIILKRRTYKLHQRNTLWFKLDSYKQVIRLGLPTGMEYFMWNASNLVLIRLLNQISYKAMAIYTLTFGIEVVIYAIFNGLSKSTMTLMGQCIGGENKEKANRYFKSCIQLDLLVVGIAMLVFILFNKTLLGLFTKDAEIISSAIPFLIMTAMIMLPKSLNVVIGNAIRAYGDTKWMLYSQVIGSIFVIGCSYGLISLGLGIGAIYITLFLDEALRASLNYYYYIRKYRKR